jgi:hypothetical protein
MVGRQLSLLSICPGEFALERRKTQAHKTNETTPEHESESSCRGDG